MLKRISSLSGGEKARVSLTKLMLAQANVLILDEPTNHLDLFSKEVLEAALLDYEGTLFFISHDRYFLNKMAERIVELTPSGIDHFLGNYDEMIEKKRELEEERLEALSKQTASAPKATAAADNAPSSSYEADKLAKREERSRQRKIEQLEKTIADYEQQISELEEQLADPAIFNDYIRIQEIQTDMETRKATLAAAYEEWEQLM
ncbi:putative ABC transporter ATP-binding protein [compost metagenome]